MVKPKFNLNEKWFIAAEVTQATVFMLGMTKCFTQEWPKLGLGDKITEYISYFKNNNCLMYFKRSEFDAEADFLANKMIQNPDWAIGILKDIKEWSDNWIENATKLIKTPLKGQSNEELITLYNNCLKWQRLQHGVGCSVSWMADADGQKVAKAIYKVLEDKIYERKSNLEPSVAFSILSTPKEESFAAKEEKEFLTLAQKFWAKPKIKNIFKQKDVTLAEKNLKKESILDYNFLYDHYNKWRWLPYGYRGPSYTFKYFWKRMQSLFLNEINPSTAINQFQANEKELTQRQQEINKELKFNADERKLIELAKKIIFIKEYRKSALYYGMYCYEFLFKEAGKRLGLTLKEMWTVNTWELEEFLKVKKAPKEELFARTGELLIYIDKKNYKIITGKAAKELYEKMPKEEFSTDQKIDELKGMCACPGEARGVVKIIEVPADMKKMKEGDILVSETTYPSLVPAMKKAAAIVTNAGGLTCHAAIVSRELRIPCVVGTKIANKVLKDGDQVEVNATKGIIKIL